MFQGTVEGGQDPAWQVDPEEVHAVSWVEPKSLTPENTRRLLWKALQAAGLAVAPDEA